jgi:hypothetical protein
MMLATSHEGVQLQKGIQWVNLGVSSMGVLM